MSRSIMTDNFEECYLCGGVKECVHHIFEGNGRRPISERHGFTVPLCNRCHNMSAWAVHFNKQEDLRLKRAAQRKYEETHTREEFIKLIGRNYL